MLIYIEYYNPEKHDGLTDELIEVFRVQTYEDRSVYHTKQAGVPIEVTIFSKDAKIVLLDYAFMKRQEKIISQQVVLPLKCPII